MISIGVGPCSSMTAWPEAASRLCHNPNAAWEVLSVKQAFKKLDTAQFVDVGPKKVPGTVRLVLVSDTHGHHLCEAHGHKHASPSIPDGDVLIHAGDFTSTGREGEVRDFNTWLGALPHQTKIVIAGNHDLTFDLENYPELWQRFHHSQQLDAARIKASLSNCIYLEDEECIVQGGLRVYGSPWQPRFYDWAFNLDRGGPLLEKWQNVPGDGIDVLVTHGPPVGHGDECESGARAGCVDLLREIQTRIKPKAHVFGHIHEGYGVTTDGQTLYMNASTCNFHYMPFNAPLVLDLPARH